MSAKKRPLPGWTFCDVAGLLVGPIGSPASLEPGKTTIARLIAAEVADGLHVEELDASDLTPGRLRDVERGLQSYGFGRGGKAVIVNEAHGLRKDTIRQLLGPAGAIAGPRGLGIHHDNGRPRGAL